MVSIYIANKSGVLKKTSQKQIHHFRFYPAKELAIPISMTPQQEQIIRHTGYTVSYNKELKLPNWVSYELTREETKGKEKETTAL